MSWAHYLLQVNIYLVIFYCFYRLLLNKETYFALNRLYLISAGLLSLSIPFLRFDIFSQKAVSDKLYISVSEINNVVTNYAILPQTQQQYDWGRIIVIAYLLGAFIYFLKFLYQLFTVNQLFKNADENDAFSFFNKKAVADSLPERATIDLHEDIHIKQLHSLDVIFFEVLCIITWFNPVIYAYKNTIKNIHEYLADEAAAIFQGDKETYSLLLLSHALGIKPNSLTNGFSGKSLIKKRIYMLHKQRSKKVAILKYGLFIPLFAITLILSSATIRKNEKILAVANKITFENAKIIVNNVFKNPLKIAELLKTEKQDNNLLGTENAVISNDLKDTDNAFNAKAFNSLYSYLASVIKYPEAAINKKIQGNALINFTIKNGRIIEVMPQVELGAGCDQMVESSLLGFYGSIPQDGKYSIKVTFKLENSGAEFKNNEVVTLEPYTELQTITINGFYYKEKNSTEKSIVNRDELMSENNFKEVENTSINQANQHISMANPPLFVGGAEKLASFLANAIKYPITAIDNEIQGIVKVNFVVEKDGTLTNINIPNKIGYGIDEEAIRVLKLTKKWHPAMQNGKPVSVAYTIPIKFTYGQDNKPSKGTIVANIRLKNYGENENSPLFIVDGQLKESTIVKDLDAKKIERINVLKDANALAIFGKKGENGAVIITSKKPENTRATATIFE